MAERSDPVRYGDYLATAGGCKECHTPQVKGQPVAGMELAGGFEFGFPDGGVARSQNLTPDPATGIGGWNEEFFVRRFKVYADPAYVDPEAKSFGRQTPMPWRMFAHMTDDDLKALYAYLRSVKPIRNAVSAFTPAR